MAPSQPFLLIALPTTYFNTHPSVCHPSRTSPPFRDFFIYLYSKPPPSFSPSLHPSRPFDPVLEPSPPPTRPTLSKKAQLERMVETPGATDSSGWGYQLPTELSPPFTLPPGVVECRDPAGVDATGARMGLGTQSPSGSGRGGAHNCAYGYGAVAEQGHRRYSGAQRDPSRPATPGTSYASVFEPQDAISTSTVMGGESFIASSHDPRRQRRWGGSRHHGSFS
ncbi:hypothetical protein BC827DRAFT_834535 [Russula dissimulans]|nr:hypothetical protein BC827DRAFT_834535 [Russula dissimulans]